jgi:hypothetical protein
LPRPDGGSDDVEASGQVDPLAEALPVHGGQRFREVDEDDLGPVLGLKEYFRRKFRKMAFLYILLIQLVYEKYLLIITLFYKKIENYFAKIGKKS